MLGAAARVDRILLWVNLFFLLFVALLPFSAGVLGGYPNSREMVWIYGLNMVMVEVFLISIWRHITRHLLREGVSQALVRAGFRRTATGLSLYLLGIALAQVSSVASLILFWVVPATYIFLQTVTDSKIDS